MKEEQAQEVFDELFKDLRDITARMEDTSKYIPRLSNDQAYQLVGKLSYHDKEISENEELSKIVSDFQEFLTAREAYGPASHLIWPTKEIELLEDFFHDKNSSNNTNERSLV